VLELGNFLRWPFDFPLRSLEFCVGGKCGAGFATALAAMAIPHVAKRAVDGGGEEPTKTSRRCHCCCLLGIEGFKYATKAQVAASSEAGWLFYSIMTRIITEDILVPLHHWVSFMQVENKLSPNEEQIKGFFEPGAQGPIYMVNLLKFKDKAEYADGRESSLSGREAYALYGEAVSKILVNLGGGGMFSAKVERLMLGEVEELWDAVGIAMYPSRQAMIDMTQSPEYQAIHHHRDAGLAGQLNIETTDASGIWLGGAGFNKD